MLSADERATIRNRHIGFVFQNFNLIPRTSAFENVELPLYYGDVPLAEQHQRAREALGARRACRPRRSRAEPVVGRPTATRRHRARAGESPALLLADEPTGNLDTQTHEIHQR